MRVRGILGLNLILPAAALAVLLIGAGYIYDLHRQIAKAQQAEAMAIMQRDQIAGERDRAIEVAKTNAATIAQLQNEKALVDQALTDLQTARTQAAVNQQARAAVIQKQANTAASKARTAPVIADTISAIQADRNKRRP